MTFRRRPSRWRAALVTALSAALLLILVQAPVQAVAMLSASMMQAFWGMSMCGPDGAKERLPSAPDQPQHDLAHCLDCQLGCASPAALTPADVAVPLPRLSRALRILLRRTGKLRRLRGFRPNARAPPPTLPASTN